MSRPATDRIGVEESFEIELETIEEVEFEIDSSDDGFDDDE